MELTEQDILNSGLKQKDFEQLQNQHQGGLNNEKGTSYELYFALYQLVRLKAKYFQQAGQVRVAKQIKCFVDDFWIDESGLQTFFQLKNVQRPAWIKKLKDDFSRQERVNKSKNIQSELYLVCSKQKKVPVLQKNTPQSLKSTKVMYFPDYESLEDLYNKYIDFKRKLAEICATGAASKSHLNALAEIILLHWQTTVQPLKEVDIDTFFQEIMRKDWPSIYLKQPHFSLPSNWPAVSAILDKIPKLTYTVDTGFLLITHPTDSYYFPYPVEHLKFRQFLNALLSSCPKSFDELEVHFYA